MAGDLHGRRVNIVGRLRTVDVIIGVHRRIAAECAAQNLVAAIGNHFIEIHVGRGTARAFQQIDDERVAMLTADDFAAGFSDGVALGRRQHADIMIGQRRRPFAQRKCLGEFFAGTDIAADTVRFSTPRTALMPYRLAAGISTLPSRSVSVRMSVGIDVVLFMVSPWFQFNK